MKKEEERTKRLRDEHSVRYVNPLPSMASGVSPSPQLNTGELKTSVCRRAIGNEFVFMNIDEAVAKLLAYDVYEIRSR